MARYRVVRPIELEMLTGPYGSIELTAGDEVETVLHECKGLEWTVLHWDGEVFDYPHWKAFRQAISCGDLVPLD